MSALGQRACAAGPGRHRTAPDGLVYFDDAGDRIVASVHLHDVAVDLPVTFPDDGDRALSSRTCSNAVDDVLARDTQQWRAPGSIVLTGQPGNGKTTISKLIVQAYRVAGLKGWTALVANHEASLSGTEAILQKLGTPAPAPAALGRCASTSPSMRRSGAQTRRNTNALPRGPHQQEVQPRHRHTRHTTPLGSRAWPSVVVFDGLDEVTKAATRRTVVERVVEFVTTPRATDLIYSRHHHPTGGLTETSTRVLPKPSPSTTSTPWRGLALRHQGAHVRLSGDEERIGKIVGLATPRGR